MATSTTADRLNKFVDWFIPANVVHDVDMRKQERIFLYSHLFGPFLGNTVPLALYCFDPEPGFQIIVLAASITGFWIFPFLLRAFGRYYLLATISIENSDFLYSLELLLLRWRNFADIAVGVDHTLVGAVLCRLVSPHAVGGLGAFRRQSGRVPLPLYCGRPSGERDAGQRDAEPRHRLDRRNIALRRHDGSVLRQCPRSAGRIGRGDARAHRQGDGAAHRGQGG